MKPQDRGLDGTGMDLKAAEYHYRNFLKALGANMNDDNLEDTPKRVAKMWAEFLTPQDFKFSDFDGEQYNEMVMCGPIPFYSVCAHHNLPFHGTAHVAYIPGEKGKIIGISKLARTVQWYAAGFQNQERITKHVADTLMQELGAAGVGVVLRARHMCMEMRGAKTHGCETTTSSLLGVFLNSATRNEFFNLINK